MLFQKVDAVYAPKNYLLWFTLTFQAGIINTGGYLALHRFVSHITGFASHFGVDVINGETKAAITSATVPLIFLIGSMISAFFIDKRRYENRVPSYLGIFILISLCFFLSGFLGQKNFFGTFGGALSTEKDFFLMALLTLGCGLQNAVITSVSHSLIRTTHLTGITTDLGIGIVRLFFRGKNSEIFKHEKSATFIRITIILGFISGSVIGTMLFLETHYWGFYLPSLLSLIIGIIIHLRIKYNIAQMANGQP